MARIFTRLRTPALTFVVAALAVAGVASAAGFGPTSAPSSTASGVAPINVSANMQQKEGSFNARTVGVSNGYCIGPACITSWMEIGTGYCPQGEGAVYDPNGKPSCTHTITLTEPGACAGGFCTPTYPVAQAVCQDNGYPSALRFTSGYANSALSSKFCADYLYSTNQYICDNNCTSGCHTMMPTVTCYGPYTPPPPPSGGGGGGGGGGSIDGGPGSASV